MQQNTNGAGAKYYLLPSNMLRSSCVSGFHVLRPIHNHSLYKVKFSHLLTEALMGICFTFLEDKKWSVHLLERESCNITMSKYTVFKIHQFLGGFFEVLTDVWSMHCSSPSHSQT